MDRVMAPGLVASNLFGLMGNVAEGSILETLHRASLTTPDIRLVRCFDFASCDCIIVDIRHQSLGDPFPDTEPFSSLERLGWAYRRRQKGSAVLCEIKTGPPHYEWLKSAADIFLVRMIDRPHQLFAIPRTKVDALYSARSSVRHRIDKHAEHEPSYPALAPYSVLELAYPALLSRLVHGTATDSPLRWTVPLQRSIQSAFAFRTAAHETSFRECWMLYEWLRQYKPAVRLHHVPTQPLGGDLLLEHDGEMFTIQHKVSHSVLSHVYSPSHSYDFIFSHVTGYGSGRLEVKLRGGETRGTFSYDLTGADDFVSFLVTHKRAARAGHATALLSILDEIVPEPAPSEPQESELQGRDGRLRLRSHQLAISFFDYVNSDPDGLNAKLACLYLNWDQEHPFGAAVILRHTWTDDERTRFRATKTLPKPVRKLLSTLDPQRCVVLRFCCREYHHVKLSQSHFPLEQLHAELPITDQKFLLISSPDRIRPDQMPESIMLFPSEFISYPQMVTKVWEENRQNVQNGVQTSFQLALLLGHTTENKHKADPLVPGKVIQSDFWITPALALRQFEELMLSNPPTMVVRHPEARASTLRSFSKHTYITNFRNVMQASIDYGHIRANTFAGSRPQGFWYAEKRKAQERQARKGKDREGEAGGEGEEEEEA